MFVHSPSDENEINNTENGIKRHQQQHEFSYEQNASVLAAIGTLLDDTIIEFNHVLISLLSQTTG